MKTTFLAIGLLFASVGVAHASCKMPQGAFPPSEWKQCTTDADCYLHKGPCKSGPALNVQYKDQFEEGWNCMQEMMKKFSPNKKCENDNPDILKPQSENAVCKNNRCNYHAVY